MATKQHEYDVSVEWTGNRGTGTSDYKAYDRTWNICSAGKPVVACSNDPLLGGDASKYNPEDLLLAAVASCHMLWYLHLCSNAGVTVTDYKDTPSGIGEMEPSGKGRFLKVILKPKITISTGSIEQAEKIHGEVHNFCFIARSVNFPIEIDPEVCNV